MKSLKTLLLITSLSLFISSPALSNSVIKNTKIKKVLVQESLYQSDVVCIYLEDPIEVTEANSCNTSNRMCYAVDTDMGRAFLGTALTAKTANNTVNIAGRDYCTFLDNSQDLIYIFIVD